jgi:hypothetical protein
MPQHQDALHWTAINQVPSKNSKPNPAPLKPRFGHPKNLNSDLIQKPFSELVILPSVFASEFRNGHLNSDEFRNWPVSQWPATTLEAFSKHTPQPPQHCFSAAPLDTDQWHKQLLVSHWELNPLQLKFACVQSATLPWRTHSETCTGKLHSHCKLGGIWQQEPGPLEHLKPVHHTESSHPAPQMEESSCLHHQDLPVQPA